MNRLGQIWEKLRRSFWFLPTCLVVAALLLGIGMVELDHRLEADLEDNFPRIFRIGAEGAQGILQSIATSMITVAGVTFSITILILSQASRQYSPRILRNFVRDRSNQFVLGAFLAIFVYCLMVLRAIQDIDEAKQVPPLAVLGGIVLALFGIGVLIFFIHHIAYSIQASTILRRATVETLDEINALYPESIGVGTEEAPEGLPPEFHDQSRWHPVRARKSGYLEFTAPEALLEFAENHDAVVRLEYRIGTFIVQDLPLAYVCRDRPLSDREEKSLMRSVSIGSYRTVEQDASFGIRQLVDIALRGLSPGMNDSTTTIMCLDHLTAILVRLVQREFASPYRFKDGHLRVIAPRFGFEELLSECLEEIRQNARGNAGVLRQLLMTVETVVPLTRLPTRLRALKQQLDLVKEEIEKSDFATADQRRLQATSDRVLRAIRLTISGNGEE